MQQNPSSAHTLQPGACSAVVLLVCLSEGLLLDVGWGLTGFSLAGCFYVYCSCRWTHWQMATCPYWLLVDPLQHSPVPGWCSSPLVHIRQGLVMSKVGGTLHQTPSHTLIAAMLQFGTFWIWIKLSMASTSLQRRLITMAHHGRGGCLVRLGLSFTGSLLMLPAHHMGWTGNKCVFPGSANDAHLWTRIE